MGDFSFRYSWGIRLKKAIIVEALFGGNLEQAVSKLVTVPTRDKIPGPNANPSVVTWPYAINRLGWPVRMYDIIVAG